MAMFNSSYCDITRGYLSHDIPILNHIVSRWSPINPSVLQAFPIPETRPNKNSTLSISIPRLVATVTQGELLVYLKKIVIISEAG